jgi:hypothetical protein
MMAFTTAGVAGFLLLVYLAGVYLYDPNAARRSRAWRLLNYFRRR